MKARKNELIEKRKKTRKIGEEKYIGKKIPYHEKLKNKKLGKFVEEE